MAAKGSCTESPQEDLLKMIEESILETVDYYLDPKLHSSEWDLDSLVNWYKQKFGITVDTKVSDVEAKEDIENLLIDTACKAYEGKRKGNWKKKNSGKLNKFSCLIK